MKKILLLGGSAQQIIAIETAKRLGYYTVLCDYLPDNPGQHAADAFYLVSTTDREKVLDVARKEQVDGVLAYASDPAAPTAAYVAEQMELPGNPSDSVEILCNKDRFREFLLANGFCSPQAKSYDDAEQALRDLRENAFHLPVMVKPVDSSGSKGVRKIEDVLKSEKSVADAFSFSRCGRIIIEEYVDAFGYQIAGDGMSVDGKLVFDCFANDHFNRQCKNPYVPVSASFPLSMPESAYEKIRVEIQRLLSLLGMKTCTYNFDIRIDAEQNVYLMEVAPRDGGNYIPDVIRYATGVDLVECAIRGAMGETFPVPEHAKADGYWSYFAVHSLENGILDRVEIADWAQEKIIENHIINQKGDPVKPFVGANSTLGCLIMRFGSMEEMLHMMDFPDEWITVELQ